MTQLHAHGQCAGARIRIRRAADVRRGGWFVRGAEESPTRIRIALSLDRAHHRLAVEPVEGLGPDRSSEPFEARPRDAGVADVEELGIGDREMGV